MFNCSQIYEMKRRKLSSKHILSYSHKKLEISNNSQILGNFVTLPWHRWTRKYIGCKLHGRTKSISITVALYVPQFRSYKLVNFHNPATGLCKAQLVYQISVYKWHIQLGKPTRVAWLGGHGQFLTM